MARYSRRATTSLDEIEIASPCEARWEEMQGDEKVRFCTACQLPVYNLSAMDVEEAAARLASDAGRLCVRFYRRRDGTILTQDCPVGVERIRSRRRVLTRAALFVCGGTTAAVLLTPMQGAVARPAARQAAFLSAAATGDLEALQLQLNAGWDPNRTFEHGTTPLMVAAHRGHGKVVRLLLAHGADVHRRNRKGDTALQLAQAAGHRRVAALLRRAGAAH